MRITASPNSRFGLSGSSVEYVVKADGATELRVREQSIPGVEARVTEMRRTAEGVEARVRLDVREGAYV